MANAFNFDVVGINQYPNTTVGEMIASTFGVKVVENTYSISGANCTVIVPNTPNGGGFTNYQVTQTLAEILTRINEDAVVDLTITDTLTIQGNIINSLTTGITAFAGGGQGSATALTKDYNIVSTVATAGDSVKLPTAVTGLAITVKNVGASALAVFPFSGDAINGGSADASVTIPVNGTMTFVANSTSNWETEQEVLAPTTLYTDTINEKTTGDGIIFGHSTIQKRTAVAINASATMADGDMTKGYITSTSALATVITTRTATQLATELGATAGTTYEFVINNVSGSNTVTLTPGAGVTAASALTGGNDMTLASTEIGVFKLVFVSTTVAQVCRVQ